MNVDCPACGRLTPHDILKSNGDATVECEDCGHVHKIQIHDNTVERRVVVSQDEDSFSTHVPMQPQTLREGEEFVLESDEGVYGVEVTSLETGSGRTDVADVEDVETVWTRVVDNVRVPVTVNRDSESTSHRLQVPGDYRFVVGETEEVDDVEFKTKAFVHRDGDRYRLSGDDAEAKNVKRLYGEEL